MEWLVSGIGCQSKSVLLDEDEMSSFKSISASIIQGSAIGPASYVVNTFDLHAVSDGN